MKARRSSLPPSSAPCCSRWKARRTISARSGRRWPRTTCAPHCGPTASATTCRPASAITACSPAAPGRTRFTRWSRTSSCRAIERRAGAALRSASDFRLLVQKQVEQRRVDHDFPVVVDQAEPPKFIHEEADARPRGADDLRKGLLVYFLQDWRGLIGRFLAEIRQQQQRSRQALFA